MVSKKLADIRGQVIKKQTTDLDNVKSFSAEGKDFRGLNKTVKVPFPRPRTLSQVQTTIPGSAPDNGKLKEDLNEMGGFGHGYFVAPGYGHGDAKRKIHHIHTFKKHAEKRGFTIKKRTIEPNGEVGHSYVAHDRLGHLAGEFTEAYIAPNTGINNYAQNLPAGVNTKKGRVKAKLDKDDMASKDAVYQGEDVISSIEQLQPIFEAYIVEELKVGEKDIDGNNEAKKVRGTNAKGPGTGKVSVVKRKYLGNQRGRTATGKPAHAIDVEPVIGAQDKNWNKTTPSGERKKG